jgi:1,2-phenylacetyl-CoA epoxidase PaaB subunit
VFQLYIEAENSEQKNESKEEIENYGNKGGYGVGKKKKITPRFLQILFTLRHILSEC